MAGNYGSNPGNGSSPRRRVHFVRGYDAVTSMSETKTAAIASGYRAGQTNEIYSGMIISLNNSGEWVRGQFAAGRTCYVASANASDTDITGSGLLTGHACTGQFVVESPWYAVAGQNPFGTGAFPAADANQAYTYVADQDNLFALPTGNVNAGFVAVAVAGGTNDDASLIIGKVVKGITALNLVTGSANTTKAVHPFTSNEAGTSEVIQFKTTQG